MPALVTIARYYDLPAAEVACSVLNAAGIPAFVFDRQFAYQHVSRLVAIGGVRVMAPAVHAHEARDILDVGEDLHPNLDGDDCPQCGAASPFRPASLVAGILALPFGAVFLVWGRRRKCRQCGQKWRVRR